MRLLTFLNYTHFLFCNFKALLFIPIFPVCIFAGFVIILVEINVEGVSLEMCKKGFYI